MLNGGDYLPMAKVAHLIIWRNAWVWVEPLLSCRTQCSLHIEHPSLSLDRGTMFEICESRIQGQFVDQGSHIVPCPEQWGQSDLGKQIDH
jgi:hypothetical protein